MLVFLQNWRAALIPLIAVPVAIVGTFGLLCSVVGVALGGLSVTIFTQIGFVVLVGLASKNAILIVEFAKQQQEQGKSRREATLEAVRLRLRPILMTSFAFILGVVPLVIATGAGAEMRRALGLAVFSGMLGVTLFGIFLTPVFYYVLQWFGRAKPGGPVPASDPGSSGEPRLLPVSPGTGIRATRTDPPDYWSRVGGRFAPEFLATGLEQRSACCLLELNNAEPEEGLGCGPGALVTVGYLPEMADGLGELLPVEPVTSQAQSELGDELFGRQRSVHAVMNLPSPTAHDDDRPPTRLEASRGFRLRPERHPDGNKVLADERSDPWIGISHDVNRRPGRSRRGGPEVKQECLPLLVGALAGRVE